MSQLSIQDDASGFRITRTDENGSVSSLWLSAAEIPELSKLVMQTMAHIEYKLAGGQLAGIVATVVDQMDWNTDVHQENMHLRFGDKAGNSQWFQLSLRATEDLGKNCEIIAARLKGAALNRKPQ